MRCIIVSGILFQSITKFWINDIAKNIMQDIPVKSAGTLGGDSSCGKMKKISLW